MAHDRFVRSEAFDAAIADVIRRFRQQNLYTYSGLATNLHLKTTGGNLNHPSFPDPRSEITSEFNRAVNKLSM